MLTMVQDEHIISILKDLSPGVSKPQIKSSMVSELVKIDLDIRQIFSQPVM